MLIIDGNNLIGSIRSISIYDKDSQDKLVDLILKYQKITHNKIILVFDGVKDIIGENIYHGNLIIKYPNGVNEFSADDIIKYQINKFKNDQSVILISSDRELCKYAKELGIKHLKSIDFANKLFQTTNKNHSQKTYNNINVDSWLKYFNK